MQQSHFGTGYSSLNYLREFPFDAIKLDRTFISGIAHVARDLSIVRSIVSLGKAFSLGIVAEGVENNEQFELLKNMNCDEFQGYYYSKPLSGDQLIDFLRGQKKKGCMSYFFIYYRFPFLISYILSSASCMIAEHSV
ncbi:TPA: EAL domain-containing protein [Klebsiella pneumoniae]|nr:EAL domain-containing protein [Klebsiella michiganensis]